jgi:hypothetical protein
MEVASACTVSSAKEIVIAMKSTTRKIARVDERMFINMNFYFSKSVEFLYFNFQVFEIF